MMHLSKKKQALIFIIGSAINLLLFCLTKYTAFPLWMDYSGTLYITAFCGPFTGAVSLVVHTLLLCLLIDKAAAILPALAIMAIMAVIWFFGQDDTKSIRKSLSVGYISVLAATFVNTIVFVCCKAPLGRYAFYGDIFKAATQSGGKFFASLLLASGLITEVILSLAIVGIAWLLTPKRGDNLIFRK